MFWLFAIAAIAAACLAQLGALSVWVVVLWFSLKALALLLAVVAMAVGLLRAHRRWRDRLPPG
jgi:uncharacterized membrane protein YhaH (DUF805 family)